MGERHLFLWSFQLLNWFQRGRLLGIDGSVSVAGLNFSVASSKLTAGIQQLAGLFVSKLAADTAGGVVVLWVYLPDNINVGINFPRAKNDKMLPKTVMAVTYGYGRGKRNTHTQHPYPYRTLRACSNTSSCDN